jgi:hypothetical protein
MAQDQKNIATGGNKPKPPSKSGGPSGQSAKERSKAQSRPVTGKTPSGKSGTATGAARKGGNTPRPGGKPAPQPQPRRMSSSMMAWGAVGLVIVIIAVLVVVKVAGGGSSSAGAKAYTPVTVAPASVVKDVTTIPASVYNKVGINFPSAAQPVSPPIKLSNQKPLTLQGKSPAMLFYGAEYCPYCAAERWAVVAALSRFGTWSGLKITASSHTDVYAETHTFSFVNATFTSPYLSFFSVEQYTNIPSGSAYTTLQNPTKEEEAVIVAGQKSIPGSTPGQVGFPFINIGNVSLISGATYNPGILSVLSWTNIAGGLDDATNPVTQSIVGTANYITASICASTKGAPASVCMSPGVKVAAKALKVS